MDADGIGLVDLISADSLEQFGERDPRFHPGQMRAQAEVRAATETQKLGPDFASDQVVVGILERPLVTMGRTGQQQQDIALGNRGVVEGELSGDDAGQDLAGGVIAQRFLDPQRNPGQVGVDRGQLIGVLVAPKRGIGKKFGGRLVAGDHHQEHEPEDFLVGEPVAVDLGFQQCRGQVVGWLLAALGDHRLVVDDQVDRRLDRRRRHIV